MMAAHADDAPRLLHCLGRNVVDEMRFPRRDLLDIAREKAVFRVEVSIQKLINATSSCVAICLIDRAIP